MKQYELMSVYNLDLGDQGAKDLSKKVSELVGSLGGKITKEDFWGKRRFAYEIKHKSEGYYDIMLLDLASENLAKLKSKLNLQTNLVRYLVTAKS
jgi:small subunit ribosomal protein S6